MNESMQLNELNENEAPEKMNVFTRIGNLIFSPKKLFLFLREKPSILFPLIILIIGSLVYQLILWEPTRNLLLDTTYQTYTGGGMHLTPDQLEQMVNGQMIATLVLSPLTLVLTWVISTWIMYAAFRLVNCEKGMKKYFSMTAYVSILAVMGMIINALYTKMTGGDIGTTQVTSLASLLNADSVGVFLQGITTNIEVFNIWTYILYGIGFIYIGGVQKNKAVTVICILFVLSALLSAGVLVLSSSITSGLTGGALTG